MPRSARDPERVEAPAEPTLVVTGRAWSQGKLRNVEVGIDDAGRITSVGRNLRGGRRRDLGERVLIPSGVDLHVHFRDPGPPGAVETFATGTLQAVLGGVATVADMPNTEPPVVDLGGLETKAARVRGRAACDVALYAMAASPRRIGALGREAGAFKLYTSPSTAVPEPVPPSEWPGLFQAVRRTDLPVAVHAEDPRRFRGEASSAKDLDGWTSHRPPAAEDRAVAAVLAAAGPARLHIAHVTRTEVLDVVRGAGHSAEVSPHHLLLSTAFHGPPALAKVNPPLRKEADRRALFEAFAAGRVPILASDHAPHPGDRKALPFGEAPSGIANVETMLPLLLDRVGRGELALPVLTAAAADRPARWLGLPAGRLLPGHAAHFLAVDFRRRTRIRSRALHGAGADSPYEGRDAVFPEEHYIAGQRVVEGGEYVGTPRGRVVRPEFARTGAVRGS